MSQQREPVPVRSWLTPAAMHAAIVVGFLVRMIFFVPGQKHELDKFGVLIPALTQVVFRISTWLVQYWVVAVIWAVALLAVDAWILRRMGGLRRRAGWLWSWGVAGSLFTLWVACELGVLLAMMKAREGLGEE